MKTTDEIPTQGTTVQDLPPSGHTILFAEGKTPHIAKLLIKMSQQARVHADTYLIDLIDTEMADEMSYDLGDGCLGIQISTVAEYPEYAERMAAIYPDLLFHYKDHAETVFVQHGEPASHIAHFQ